MANRPIDDFDPRDGESNQEPHEVIDDAADFGQAPQRGQHSQGSSNHSHDDIHDDADFVDDDMNDIVDDADPLADNDHENADDFEDHDDEAQHDEAEPIKAPSRFSIGSIIFYVIIAAVIGGGGYMAYRTFVTGGEPVSPGTVLEASKDAAKSVIVPTDTNMPTAPVPATNSAPVPSPAAAANTADLNSGWQTTLPPEAAAGAAAPAPQAPSQQAPSQQAPSQQAAAQQAAAQQPSVPLPIATRATVNEAVAPVAGAATSNTEAMASINARLAETETRLAQMTGTVSNLTQQLQTANNKVATLEQRPAAAASTAVPVSGVSASDIVNLRDQNTTLQKQVQQLTKTQQSLQSQLASNQAAPRPAATPKTPKPTASVMAEAEPTAAMSEQRSPKTRAPAPAKTNNWVLRAATPGMAWVSPQPGSADLKRVVQGDTLDGIGQVTAIRQDNGRWIVEGSQGTIR